MLHFVMLIFGLPQFYILLLHRVQLSWYFQHTSDTAALMSHTD